MGQLPQQQCCRASPAPSRLEGRAQRPRCPQLLRICCSVTASPPTSASPSPDTAAIARGDRIFLKLGARAEGEAQAFSFRCLWRAKGLRCGLLPRGAVSGSGLLPVMGPLPRRQLPPRRMAPARPAAAGTLAPPPALPSPWATPGQASSKPCCPAPCRVTGSRWQAPGPGSGRYRCVLVTPGAMGVLQSGPRCPQCGGRCLPPSRGAR